jgi:ribonuclease D
MLDGKDHYNLHEVWIITTSNLTSAAITTAKNNRIQILKRENVIQFLAELKKHDNVKFKRSVVEQVKIINEKETIDNPLYSMLKELRKELAKKHKITPLYYVYSNSTIVSIINTIPKTKDELKSVEGLGTKKIELYGEEIINTVSNYLISNEFIKEFERFKVIRSKIMSFNKLPNENSVITDENLMKLIINRPKTIEELMSLCVIEDKNIKIFGQYLVKQFIQI